MWSISTRVNEKNGKGTEWNEHWVGDEEWGHDQSNQSEEFESPQSVLKDTAPVFTRLHSH
jgi:hypothetical protein